MALITVEGLDELRERLDPKIVDLALTSTLNKVGAKLKTAVSRDIRQVYNVSAKAVRDTLELQRARLGNQEAFLVSTGPRLPLKEFGARQNRRGVAVKIKKAGRRPTIISAFIVDKLGGNVFKREGSARFPLKKLLGPAIPQMMSSPEVLEKLLAQAQLEAPKVFEHELTFRIKRTLGEL